MWGHKSVSRFLKRFGSNRTFLEESCRTNWHLLGSSERNISCCHRHRMLSQQKCKSWLSIHRKPKHQEKKPLKTSQLCYKSSFCFASSGDETFHTLFNSNNPFFSTFLWWIVASSPQKARCSLQKQTLGAVRRQIWSAGCGRNLLRVVIFTLEGVELAAGVKRGLERRASWIPSERGHASKAASLSIIQRLRSDLDVQKFIFTTTDRSNALVTEDQTPTRGSSSIWSDSRRLNSSSEPTAASKL